MTEPISLRDSDGSQWIRQTDGTYRMRRGDGTWSKYLLGYSVAQIDTEYGPILSKMFEDHRGEGSDYRYVR